MSGSAIERCGLCGHVERCVKAGCYGVQVCFACTSKLNLEWGKEAAHAEAQNVIERLSPTARVGLEFVGKLLQKRGRT